MAVAFRLFLPSFLASTSSSSSSSSSITRRVVNLPLRPPLQSVVSAAASHHTLPVSTDFTWNDVVSLSQHDDSSDLRGFFDKVALCNRNSEKLREFIPFVIDEEIVGYVHNGFAHHLRSFKDVFTFPEDSSYGSNFGCYLALHPLLSTPEDRTKAVADVVKLLAGELIPGIRNELYPVKSSFGTPEFFSLERAAAPYFGIKAYGIHLNGYVERENQDYLWVGKRSKTKSKYPGMLDHLVAGGLPHGLSCAENVVKECKEEAGIPSSISSKATAVGAVTYSDIDGYRFNRDVLFCYDLKLPEDFLPTNEDGEVESFKLLPVERVANIVRSTEYYKANCNLVIIDFLFRRGYDLFPVPIYYLDEVAPRNDEVAPRNNEVRNGQLAPEKYWSVRKNEPELCESELMQPELMRVRKNELELCESELMRVRKNEFELCESELMRARKNELEAELLRRQNAELEPELQFKGPVTRLRAKNLQGYLQVLIRKKFEDLEDARSSHILVNLLTNEDRI